MQDPDELTEEEFEQGTVDGVPARSLMAAKRLIDACLETFPEPSDCPDPLRSVLAESLDIWQTEVEKVLAVNEAERCLSD